MCQFDFPRDLHYWLKISSYQNNNHLTWVKSPSGAYGPIKVWIYPLNLNTTHCDGGEPELQCTLLHALPKVLCDVQWPHPPLCHCPVSENCWTHKIKLTCRAWVLACSQAPPSFPSLVWGESGNKATRVLGWRNCHRRGLTTIASRTDHTRAQWSVFVA